ncbi:unnamed protein product, partial [Rotaria sordida]
SSSDELLIPPPTERAE